MQFTDLKGRLDPLRRDDLPAMVRICKSAMPLDFVSAEIMAEKTFDSTEATTAFGYGFREESGSLIAFIWAAKFNTQHATMGGIRLLAVLPEFQQQFIGTSLLRAAEEHFRECNTETVQIMAMPGNYLTPGVNPLYTNAVAFLHALGYRQESLAYTLTCDSSNQDRCTLARQALEIMGYQFRRATLLDNNVIMEFVIREWRGAAEEVQHALRRKPPAVTICTFHDAVVGLIAVEGNNPGTGSMGPLGVSVNHRGQGIARVLLCEAVKDIAARQLKLCKLCWASPALIGWFSRELKAGISETHLIFRKRLL